MGRLHTHARLRGTVVVATLAMVVGLIVGPSGVATGSEPVAAPETSRLAGDSRYGTAVEISQEAFPDGAPVVYVARADTFPDALAGGALTAGPILLVPTAGDIPAVVLAEVERLDPDKVLALGGPGAVPGSQLTAVAQGRPTGRLAGDNRYGTAVEISQEAFPDGASLAYVARADTFPDALAGGALTGGPILLVPPTGEVPQAVLDELLRLDPIFVYALGGPGAVSDEVLDAAADGRTGARLAGDSRYGTAVEIAQKAFRNGAPTVYLARADTFPDALAGGLLTAGPILLVPPTGDLPDVVKGELQRLGPTRIVALGGAGAIEDGVLDAAASAVTYLGVHPGDLAFTVGDASGSAVLAVHADGSIVREVHVCGSPTCGEIDWEATGGDMVLFEAESGLHRFDGHLMEHTQIRTNSNTVQSQAFDASDLLAGDPAFAHFWRVGGQQGYGVGRITRTGGTTTSGGPDRAPPSFQTISSTPARSACEPAMLHMVAGEGLAIVGCPPGQDAGWESVAAHAQPRGGATLLGAALVPDGSGDIVITDVTDDGLLRIVPYAGDELSVPGLSVTSTPYVMPDHESVIVLAERGAATALVEVDRATGESTTLVHITGAGDADRRISSSSDGSHIAWSTGSDIRILDVATGEVEVVTPPDGMQVVGGPAFRRL